MTPERVLRTYITLVAVSTGASSMIWGINTLFLLDAGLSIGQAFAANAFFTAGLVLFEVPTGVVADTRGRRMSYLVGTITLAASTLLYLWMWRISAPFWAWALASMGLGLGFTFFSGAVEAWLIDALDATGYTGHIEAVFGRGQVVTGIAMLVGYVGGGFLAGYGTIDFAGGLVVHLNAGVAGLTAAYVVGARRGYGHDNLAPFDLTLAVVGTGLLWVGWFGFNGGSPPAPPGRAGAALVAPPLPATRRRLPWVALGWGARGTPGRRGLIHGAAPGGRPSSTPASASGTPTSKRRPRPSGWRSNASAALVPCTEIESRLAPPNPFSKEGRQMQRFFYAGAVETDLDRQGRVTIPAALMQRAKLARDVVVAGVHDHLEIWDRSEWQRELAEVEGSAEDVAERLAAHSD